MAFLYDVKEFILPCLKQCEELKKKCSVDQTESSKNMDWQQINKKYYTELLVMAVNNNFKTVQTDLMEAINQFLS